MSRGLDSAVATALGGSHVTLLLLLELGWDSGTQYITSAPHDVEWSGHTYIAAQGIGSIEPTTETATEARGLTFTLSAVPGAAIAAALTEPVQGRPVTLRLGIVDAGVLRVDPNVWSGSFDVMTIDARYPNPTIRVTAEHAMLAWQTPSGALFSDAEQQADHAGDKFFEFAAQMAEATLVWPAKTYFEKQ